MRPRVRDVLAGVLFVGAVGLGWWHQRHHAEIEGNVVARVVASSDCGPQMAARLSGLPEIAVATWDQAHDRVIYRRTKDTHRRVVKCTAKNRHR